MRRLISGFLAVVLVLAMLPATVLAAPKDGMANFTLSKSYKQGIFLDVAANAWYAGGVATAYELGLMQGNGATFSPDNSVTLAEAVTMAARLHSIYTTGKDEFVQGKPWYQVYVDYAVTNGILTAEEFSDYTLPATRAQMAHIFAGALPGDALPAINRVSSLPDVGGHDRYAVDIFKLYRAGVLTGNDGLGTFDSDGAFNRAQAATIIARMALPEQRKSLSLTAQTGKLSSAVQPLDVVRTRPDVKAVGSVEPYGKYYLGTKMAVSEDLSQARDLAYSLAFSDATTFAGLPAGFDPAELIEWGKDPGLNVDVLHDYGFTGKGAVIAYVDQPIPSHEQYDELELHYTNNTDSSESMHGPAVLSLLAGEDTGTAPEAEVYYYGNASWKADQTTHAECLYQIIEQNKSLPVGEKITMVGFSDVIDPREKNEQALREAVTVCEQAGIMVWFCDEYGVASYLPMSNKNDPENLVCTWWPYEPKLVYVPDSGRTTATNQAGAEYIYWGQQGGHSWAMPYVFGLYAIVNEIDPSLTQDELRKLIVDTAYINNAGMRIVNPVGFVAAALKGVGRNAEAQALLDEAESRTKYLYAVMDPDTMSKADYTAVKEYLSTITCATVLVVDAGNFSSAESLYKELQSDALARGGTVTGVQIFGTSDAVPAFQVQYKAQMYSGVDESGYFLSDLFYGNFDNLPEEIGSGYNVMDHFAEGWDVDLVPDWPVVRLPLEKGKFAAFFEKYEGFVKETGLERPNLVNFSNPIFKQTTHTDDMGTFLNRMNEEFGLLDVDYRLYGNLDGQYPVTTKVLGGFTKENVAKENDAGVMELLINSHGQWNNIDQCIFVDGKEQRISFLNMKDINAVLDSNCYYLDCWTCHNGYGMKNNLTTTALNGKCVGMFSATTTISNNGVNCRANVEKMKQSNFYFFYYSYLKALNEGCSRGQAFFAAQQAYAEALITDSVNGIRNDGNYQFNLHNLLAYHNFGVLESDFCSITVYGEQKRVTDNAGGTSGTKPIQPGVVAGSLQAGEVRELVWSDRNELTTGSYTIHSYTAQLLESGKIRFTIEYTAPAGMKISFFDPPKGEHFMLTGSTAGGQQEKQSFDVEKEDVRAVDTITAKFYTSNSGQFWVFIQPSGL